MEAPDELCRRAKAEATLRGRKLRDLIEEGLRLMPDGSRKPGRLSSLAERTKRDPQAPLMPLVIAGIAPAIHHLEE